MVSSFFTRPPGLHPTPSACFPPPPPPPKGTIKCSFSVLPLRFHTGALCTINWEACNSQFTTGSPVNAAWTLPGLTSTPTSPIGNCGTQTVGSTGGLVPGFYTGKVVFTWSNGQTRTLQCVYEIWN